MLYRGGSRRLQPPPKGNTVDSAKKHTCLLCGRAAAETRSVPLQCLHRGGLGFFQLFLAPRPPRLRAAGAPLTPPAQPRSSR